MNTKDIAAEYRLSHWAGIMKERAASGLSIKAFCKSAGIHTNVYHYWQRKLREAACAELAAINGPMAATPNQSPMAAEVVQLSIAQVAKQASSIIKQAPPNGNTAQNNVSETSLVPNGWTQVNAEEATPPDVIATVEPRITIEIGKCRVIADAGVDGELLSRVCRVLTTLC